MGDEYLHVTTALFIGKRSTVPIEVEVERGTTGRLDNVVYR
jgi:hypothetical protein